jgi:hypothetical protein
MAATETAERQRQHASPSETRRKSIGDETKNALKTTEFFAMAIIIGRIVIGMFLALALKATRS